MQETALELELDGAVLTHPVFGKGVVVQSWSSKGTVKGTAVAVQFPGTGRKILDLERCLNAGATLHVVQVQPNNSLVLEPLPLKPLAPRYCFDETWASYWIAESFGYLLSARVREEWPGDLHEVVHEMLEKYPRWWINVIVVLRVLRLVVSSIEIKISDLISIGARKSE